MFIIFFYIKLYEVQFCLWNTVIDDIKQLCSYILLDISSPALVFHEQWFSETISPLGYTQGCAEKIFSLVCVNVSKD